MNNAITSKQDYYKFSRRTESSEFKGKGYDIKQAKDVQRSDLTKQ